MYKISLSLSLQKKSLQSSIKICPRPMDPHAPTLPFPVALAYMWEEENLKFITNCMKGIQRHFNRLL